MRCVIDNKALVDISKSLRMIGAAWYFAVGDLKSRYKRSAFGPLWLVLSTAISVVGLGYIWAALLKMETAKFVPSLTVGLVVWQFIAGCVSESPNVFYKNSRIIRNLKVPYLLFPIQLLMKHVLNFAHNFIVVVFVFCLFPSELSLTYLLFIPGFFLVLMNMMWVSTLLGMMSARFRDIEALVTSFMPLLFFLSPVLYTPDNLGTKAKLMWLNPVAYLITLMRDPLQGKVPHLFVYVVSLGALVLGASFTVSMMNKKYNRIAFWL